MASNLGNQQPGVMRLRTALRPGLWPPMFAAKLLPKMIRTLSLLHRKGL